MSDMVEKLRELSRWLIANDVDLKMPGDMIDPEVAADEIERLRKALVTQGETLGKWKNAFEALMYCWMAAQYKEQWVDYDPGFDYEAYALELIKMMDMDCYVLEVRKLSNE
jgi:hypothetical protein